MFKADCAETNFRSTKREEHVQRIATLSQSGISSHSAGVGSNCSPLPLAGTPTRVAWSSASLQWPECLFEKRVHSPGEFGSYCVNRHVIALHCGPPADIEFRSSTGSLLSRLNQPGTFTIIPSGLTPALYLRARADVIYCALTEEFVSATADQMGAVGNRHPQFRIGVRHSCMQQLFKLLAEEVERGGGIGRHYAASLVRAVAVRYVLLSYDSSRRFEPPPPTLSPRVVQRIRRQIVEHLDTDLKLKELASQSGYSRAHFVRLFREATGVTPHQYILELRLKRAQEYLKHEKTPVIDIAALCGFASQSHMTGLFRKKLNVTPAEYRRGL